MTLVNGSSEDMLGGVSQQSPLERDPSEATEQINGWSSPAFGLLKRPPTVSHAQMVNSPTGFTSAFDHTIRRDAATRDRMIVKNGEVKVFDAFTGNERTVTGGTSSYLATSVPVRDIRAVTVGDETFISNRAITVKRTTDKSAALTNGALVTIKTADFLSAYEIKLSLTVGSIFPPSGSFGGIDINSIISQPVTISIETPAGTTPDQRAQVGTLAMAQQFLKLLNANSQLTAIYYFTVYGPTIFIQRKDGQSFALAVRDSLAGQGLQAIRNEIQNFADLPPLAPQDYKVHVTGSPDTLYDDYWVIFDSVNTVAGQGVWRETVAPDLYTELDATTMPHVLKRHTTKPFSLTATAFPDDHFRLSPWYEQQANVDSLWTLNGSGVTSKTRPILTASSDSMTCYLPLAANKDARLYFHFKLDATTMAVGNYVEVIFSFETGVGTGVYTELFRKLVHAGDSTQNFQDADVTCLSGTNQKVKVTLAYLTAPASASKQAIVTFSSQDEAGAGIGYTKKIGTLVSIDPDVKLPVSPSGSTLTVTSPSDSYFAHGDDPKARIDAAYAHFALNAGLGVSRVTDYAFIISYASLATSGIPNVTIAGGYAFSLIGAMIVYDPAANLSLKESQVGATVTGYTAGGVATGFVATVYSYNENSVFITWNFGVDPDPTGGEVLFTSPGVESFIFAAADWRGRECGDDTTNPFPSFYNRTITDVFFHRGRLGFLSDDRIILSSTADLFNFWRQTALQLLDDDLIDIQNATAKPAFFHSAVEWDGQLLVFSDLQVFDVEGEPTLTPKSIKLKALMNVDSSRNVKPLALGRRVFIPRVRATAGNITEVVELSRDPVADGSGLRNTSVNLPSYMTGAPRACAGDDGAGLFFVLTDTGNLYVHSYKYEGGNKVLNSWSQWTVAGTILGMDMDSGVLSLVVSHAEGIYLETIDLTQRPTYSVSHADRQGFTTPVAYTFSYTLSTIYPTRIGRDYKAHRDVLGKLQLRFITFTHVGSASYTVTVSNSGRADKTHVFTAAAATDGIFQTGIMGRNTSVTIVITDSSVYPCGFKGYSWEGTYHTRSQRLS